MTYYISLYVGAKRLVFHLSPRDGHVIIVSGCLILTAVYLIVLIRMAYIERFSYDLEMKTREQNRNNKRTEIERFDWFIERIQTHLAFGWLNERSAEKTSCPKNFPEIALTSYCNTIGQSNNAFSILGFSLAGKGRVHVLFFSTIG